EQAGVDRHPPARQAEGIGLVGLDHVDVPVELLPVGGRFQAVPGRQLRSDLVDLVDQPLRDARDLLRRRIRAWQRRLLAEDLLVGLQAQRAFLLGAEVAVDQHRLAGVGVLGAVGQVVAASVDQEAKHHQYPQPATEATTTPAGRLPALWIHAHRLSLSLVRYHAPRGSRCARWSRPNPPAGGTPPGSGPASLPRNRRAPRARGTRG